MNQQQPIAILIAALGGEGGGVLAEWLVELAVRAGHPAQATSIPGVAQRTGATTYYVEIHPQTLAALDGRVPVLSLAPVPGCVDLMVASELLEAVRAIQNGFVSRERSLLLTSSQRTLTTFEKIALGDGRFDSARLLEVAAANSRRLAALEVESTAREAGTVPSAVLFGAIAASGVLPFARTSFEEVIRASERSVEASLRGFALGFERCRAAIGAAPAPTITPERDLVALGHARVVDFQDAAYGELYWQRIERLRAAERRADPQGVHDGTLAREGARFLALWMAFADEQALIERWLAAVEDAATREWQPAFELALCARLIKGYGTTNERAKENLRHIIDHLANKDADAIHQAREAALADEGGRALDQALRQAGVAPRPLKPVPVRWLKREGRTS